MPRYGSTTARGYDSKHQRLREQWRTKVDSGHVDCARCGRWIPPGTPWDLGHDDHDRTIYRGPEHRACNRAAAARKVNNARRNRRLTGWTERRSTPEPRTRDCPICGSTYRASSRDQRTCSRACGAELRRRNAPPRTTPSPQARHVSCIECGTEFAATRGRKLCGEDCRTSRHRRYMREYYHRNPEYMEATKARSRARHRERNSRRW